MRATGRRLLESKGPRAFAFEVLVVVAGVLIALGAQQMVDDWSAQRRVTKGEQLLRSEAAETAEILIEQVVTAPCVVAQIDRLKLSLNQTGAWRGAAATPTPNGPAVIRAPSRPLSDSAWRSLISDGTATEFGSDQARATSRYYAQLASLALMMDQTDAERARLNFLAEPVALDTGTRAGLAQLLGELRWTTGRQAMKANQLLTMLAALDRLLDTDLTGPLASPTSTAGVCRAQNLPLAQWQRPPPAAPTAAR